MERRRRWFVFILHQNDHIFFLNFKIFKNADLIGIIIIKIRRLQETKTSPSLVSQLINKAQIIIIGIIKVIEIDNQGQIALQETKTSPSLVSQLINKAQIIITGIINVMERETKEKNFFNRNRKKNNNSA